MGLYIGEDALYVAEVVKQGKRIEVSHSSFVETPGLHFFEPSRFSQSLPEMLSSLFRKADIQPGRVNIALKGNDAFIRFFEIPLISKKEWPGAIRYEAQKYAPFPVRELDYDYLTWVEKEKKILKVVFAGAKKEIIEHQIGVLQKAGLEVRAIEPVALSLIRYFLSEKKYPSQNSQMLIHREKSSINTLVVKDGFPLLFRNGVLTPSSDREENLNHFRSEVRLAFDYFSKSFKHENVERVLLCSDEASDPFGQALSEELNLPVEILIPQAPLDHQTEGHLSGMSCAVGLALKGLIHERSREFNLISTESKRPSFIDIPDLPPTEERRLLKKWALIEGGCLVGIALVLYLGLGLSEFLLNSKVSEMRRENNRLSLQLPDSSIEGLRSLEAELQLKNRFLVSLLDRRVSWTAKMNEIIRTLPDGVWLTRMDYRDLENLKGESSRSLVLEGNMLSKPGTSPLKIVNRFVADLSGNPSFMKGLGEVKVLFIRKEDVEGVVVTRFSLDCRVL